MNPLGVHALVFAGSWGGKDRERAVAGAARLGYDLIEIPCSTPRRSMRPTAKLLERHGIKSATSLGLNFKADISSPDAAIAKRGEALLSALAVTATSAPPTWAA
jgi:D-psicose/D-tagatose/L-ribulose 3-epimerase